MDFRKNPQSWKVGGSQNPKKLLLMQRTDLTNRQVRQYFSNHQNDARLEDALGEDTGDDEEDEDDSES